MYSFSAQNDLLHLGPVQSAGMARSNTVAPISESNVEVEAVAEPAQRQDGDAAINTKKDAADNAVSAVRSHRPTFVDRVDNLVDKKHPKDDTVEGGDAHLFQLAAEQIRVNHFFVY